MGLPVPREPVEIKRLIMTVRAELQTEDEIDRDTLAVWSFNRLPKYLWSCWKDELNRRGITWQKFLRILKLHAGDAIEWVFGSSLSWEELIGRLEVSINRYSREGEAP